MGKHRGQPRDNSNDREFGGHGGSWADGPGGSQPQSWPEPTDRWPADDAAATQSDRTERSDGTWGYEAEEELERPKRPPLYAQALGLRTIAPGGFLCFLYFEGAIALGVIGGLTGLVSWWGVAAIPAAVAIAVKINDLVAGGIARSRTDQAGV